jgi:ATP-binding cassette subfamily B (MDR/TAP) protein 1
MDGGVVVQRGTHDELMAAGGMYRKMALAQELHRGADAPKRATDTATKDQHEVSSDESSTSPEVNLKELAPNPSAPDGPVAVSSGVHSRYTLLLQGRRWQLALGMIGSIGAGAVNPLFAWCLGQTLNVFTGNPRDIISQSELWSGIFGGLAIFTLIVNFFHVCFLSLSSDECASLLRSISFEASWLRPLRHSPI